MLPLLAASTVIGAVDTLANSAVSTWKAMTDGSRASGVNASSSTGESFTSLLLHIGVTGTGPLQAAGLTLPASALSVGTSRLLSRVV